MRPALPKPLWVCAPLTEHVGALIRHRSSTPRSSNGLAIVNGMHATAPPSLARGSLWTAQR